MARGFFSSSFGQGKLKAAPQPQPKAEPASPAPTKPESSDAQVKPDPPVKVSTPVSTRTAPTTTPSASGGFFRGSFGQARPASRPQPTPTQASSRRDGASLLEPAAGVQTPEGQASSQSVLSLRAKTAPKAFSTFRAPASTSEPSSSQRDTLKGTVSPVVPKPSPQAPSSAPVSFESSAAPSQSAPRPGGFLASPRGKVREKESLDLIPVDIVHDERPLYFEAVNDGQVVYESRSRIKPFRCFLPRAIAQQITEAMDRLEADVGDIDEYVSAKLEWSPAEMASYINSGQVDAVALIINATDNNTGFLEADVTGFGKGRIVACTCRYAILSGKTPVFLTKSDNLLSDFWRDVRDIGSEELFGTPFLINTGVHIMDLREAGRKIIPAMRRKDHKATLTSGELPEGTRLVMGTYSQFRSRTNAQRAFMTLLLENRRCHFVLDEAQDFSSEEAITNEIISEFLTHAVSETFITASAGKDIEYLAAYERVFPWLKRMPDMGGMDADIRASISEVSVMEAARSGRLIRREQDMTDLNIVLRVDETSSIRDDFVQDRQAPIFQAFSEADGLITEWVNSRNEANIALMDALSFVRNKCRILTNEMYGVIGTNLNPDNEVHQAFGVSLRASQTPQERFSVIKALKPGALKGLREKWTKADIDTRLALLDSQLQVSMLCKQAVGEVISTLKRGEKPVVVLDSTMEGFLQELKTGQADADEQGNDDLAIRPPTFRDIMRIVLERLSEVKVRYGGKKQESIPLTEREIPELPEAAAQCLAEISRFPEDVPASPLDAIREGVHIQSQDLYERGEIERAWRIGEISGRETRVNQGRYENIPSKEKDRNFLVASFNQGALDGLILTKKGSTGLSIHDTEGRRRHMIIVKAPASPKEFIQMVGRVRRTGQVSEPRFSWLCTTVPRQQLMLANQNRKIRAISASVTGARRSALELDIPDFLTPLGNEVAYELLMANQKLARRLKIFLWKNRAEAERELYFVTAMFRRSSYLPVELQKVLFKSFDDAHRSRLETSIKKADMLDGDWRLEERVIVESGAPSEDGFDNGHVFMTTLAREVELYPFTRADVEHMVQQAPEVKTADYAMAIRARSAGILKSYLPPHTRESEAAVLKRALADKESHVHMLNRKLEFGIKLVEAMTPGRGLKMLDEEGSPIEGVLVSTDYPDLERAAHFQEYAITYAVPGEDKVRVATLDMMMRGAGALNVLKRERSEDLMALFDTMPRGEVTIRQKVLDGNMLRAIIYGSRMECNQKVTFTTTTGQEMSGVHVPRRKYDDVINARCVVTHHAQANAVMTAGGRLFSGQDDDESVVIYSSGMHYYTVSLPRNPKVLAQWSFLEAFNPDFRSVATVSLAGELDLKRLTELAAQAGTTLYYEGLYRHRCTQLTLDMQKDVQPEHPVLTL